MRPKEITQWFLYRRQINISKENQRQHEHFDVPRFSMARMDESQFTVQDRMWAKKPPAASSVNQSSGDVWSSNRYWKSVSTSVRVFGVAGCVLVPLGELQSPIQYLTP